MIFLMNKDTQELLWPAENTRPARDWKNKLHISAFKASAFLFLSVKILLRYGLASHVIIIVELLPVFSDVSEIMITERFSLKLGIYNSELTEIDACFIKLKPFRSVWYWVAHLVLPEEDKTQEKWTSFKLPEEHIDLTWTNWADSVCFSYINEVSMFFSSLSRTSVHSNDHD